MAYVVEEEVIDNTIDYGYGEENEYILTRTKVEDFLRKYWVRLNRIERKRREKIISRRIGKMQIVQGLDVEVALVEVTYYYEDFIHSCHEVITVDVNGKLELCSLEDLP